MHMVVMLQIVPIVRTIDRRKDRKGLVDRISLGRLPEIDGKF